MKPKVARSRKRKKRAQDEARALNKKYERAFRETVGDKGGWKVKRTGNKGHRLSPVPVSSPEIERRRRQARAKKPVTVRKVDPLTHDWGSAAGGPAPTARQLSYIADLERERGVNAEPPQTRKQASLRIAQLKRLPKR